MNAAQLSLFFIVCHWTQSQKKKKIKYLKTIQSEGTKIHLLEREHPPLPVNLKRCFCFSGNLEVYWRGKPFVSTNSWDNTGQRGQRHDDSKARKMDTFRWGAEQQRLERVIQVSACRSRGKSRSPEIRGLIGNFLSIKSEIVQISILINLWQVIQDVFIWTPHSEEWGKMERRA